MKKTNLITIILLLLLFPTANAFISYSTTTYETEQDGRYSGVIISSAIEQFIINQTKLDEYVIRPNVSSTKLTNLKIPQYISWTGRPLEYTNVKLFGIKIKYDPELNAEHCDITNFTNVIEQSPIIVIEDRAGTGLWNPPLNNCSTWKTDKYCVYYFEADENDFDETQGAYIIDLDVWTTAPFCPTIQIITHRQLTGDETDETTGIITEEEIHDKAMTIFGFTKRIIKLNYNIWLVGYWILLIFLLIGAVALFFAIPFMIYKQIKRL